MNRREFLTGAAGVAAVGAMPHSIAPAPSMVAVIRAKGDSAASHLPVGWAVERLSAALKAKGVTVVEAETIDAAPPGAHCVAAGGELSHSLTASAAKRARQVMYPAETTALMLGRQSGRTVSHCTGADARGLMYSLLELADRVEHAHNP